MSNFLSKRAYKFVVAALLVACCGVVAGCAQQTAAPSQDTQSAATETQAAAQDAIEVMVEVDSANAHNYDSKYPETLGTYTVELGAGQTAFDALVATGVEYTTQGGYVDSIGGIAGGSCGAMSGWLYLVDGEMAMVSADEYELSGGETVKWAFTCEEGDVQ